MNSSFQDASPPNSQAEDRQELARFGYAEQLRRSMGTFSSFAVSFSLISITTGIFANFGFGLQRAGPAIVWSWSIAAIGQILVALVLADLAARYPLSGYGYQWTSRLIGPRYGFFVGWFLLVQLVTSVVGICKALADNLTPIITAHTNRPIDSAWVTVGIISVIAFIHLFGIRLVAIVNDVGVLTELLGTAAITVALGWMAWRSSDRSWEWLLNSTNFESGQPASVASFAQSLLLGAWCLTGFEAAADLAEETHQPRKTVPRAIQLSILSSAVGGLLMLIAFVWSIEDLRSAQASRTPLIDLFQFRLGASIAPWVVLVVAISIFACGVAGMAAATRLLFALARDNMIVGSGLWKRVHPHHQIPRNAIWLVWGLNAIFVVVLTRIGQFDVVTSLSTIAGYLGYAGIVAAAVRCPTEASPGHFRLGVLRLPIALMALAWTLGLVAVLVAPLTNADQPYVPLVATVIGLTVGVLIYVVSIRARIRSGQAGPPLS